MDGGEDESFFFPPVAPAQSSQDSRAADNSESVSATEEGDGGSIGDSFVGNSVDDGRSMEALRGSPSVVSMPTSTITRQLDAEKTLLEIDFGTIILHL